MFYIVFDIQFLIHEWVSNLFYFMIHFRKVPFRLSMLAVKVANFC